jgi:hypothetical protein
LLALGDMLKGRLPPWSMRLQEGRCASPALAKRLADAESELAGLANKTHTTPQVAPEALPPRIVDAHLEAVRDLPKTPSETDVDCSRARLLELLG